MEKFADFLSSQATWQSVGQNTSLCINEDIDKRLEFLPLGNGKPRAWKTTGHLTIESPEGLLLPVKIISGEPQISDGKTTKKIEVNSEPISFKKGDILSGYLYYITTPSM